MSRSAFDDNQRAPAAEHSDAFQNSIQQGGQDERASVSDSEDGSYPPYHEAVKSEMDSEDEHSALTSQTLNTDGTPKRPMNAFMIFARRRRPQVSAENQAMRTGEISKILSREWNQMPTAEKQFYQDQARQLKDTFNLKYPDYIYRRRPNNSRRKRKDPPGTRSSDGQFPLEVRDDMGFDDTGDSPTEGEDLHTPEMPDTHRSRPSHDVHTYGDHASYHTPPSRASPYAYPPNEQSVRSSAHENRLPFEPSAGSARLIQDSAPTHSPHSSQSYSYMPDQPHGRASSQPVPAYGQSSMGSNNTWTLPSVRSTSWLSPAEQQSQRSLSAPRVRRSTSSTWQRPGHVSGNISANSPTLLQPVNSPFSFPNDATGSLSAQLSHTQSISPHPYGPGQMQQPLLGGRDFDDSDLSLSPSLSNSAQPYDSNAGRDGSMYHQRHPAAPRGLPSISNYSQSQPTQYPPSLGGPQGYWTPRD